MNHSAFSDSRRAFLSLLVKAPLIPAAVLLTRKASAALAPQVRQVLMNDFPIAGFRYYDGTKELPALTVGTRLTLRAEPTNPHEPFAVDLAQAEAAELRARPSKAAGTWRPPS